MGSAGVQTVRRCSNSMCRVQTFLSAEGHTAFMGCPLCLLPGAVIDYIRDGATNDRE